MKTGSVKHLAFGLFLAAASNAQAGAIFDFVTLTQGSAQLGESAWSTLSLTDGGFTMDITGTKAGQDAFAYLDWGHAGLGVCGGLYNSSNDGLARPGNRGNLCNPASDDNVTVAEYLTFVFTQDVIIEKIWLNNTHDPNPSGQIMGPETVAVNGVSTVVPGNAFATGNAYNNQANLNANVDRFMGSYSVAADTAFTLGYGGVLPEQFYVSGLEVRLDNPPFRQTSVVPVPVPGSLLLVGIGMLGLISVTRKRLAQR